LKEHSDLDKILFIKGIRDYYDDEDIHKEEFEQLYHKITRILEFAENIKRIISKHREIPLD